MTSPPPSDRAEEGGVLGESLVAVDAAARFLGVGRSTMYRYAGRIIPCVRFGDFVRFKPRDLREFVERNTRRDAPTSPAGRFTKRK